MSEVPFKVMPEPKIFRVIWQFVNISGAFRQSVNSFSAFRLFWLVLKNYTFQTCFSWPTPYSYYFIIKFPANNSGLYLIQCFQSQSKYKFKIQCLNLTTWWGLFKRIINSQFNMHIQLKSFNSNFSIACNKFTIYLYIVDN